MSKTLEQTIHEAELPTPAVGGEEFTSYISRVAHAAAFIGAAWAIANGPQPVAPQTQPIEDFRAAEAEVSEAAYQDMPPERPSPIHVHQDGPQDVVQEFN